MIIRILLSLSFLCNVSLADMTQAKVDAKVLGDTMSKYVPTTVGDVPGFVGTDVPETKLDKNSIETSKFNAAVKDETYQMIKESIEKRAPYEIDVINDPIFTHSNQILLKAEHGEDEVESPKTSQHKCYRGRNVYESKCHITMVPVLSGTRKEIKTKQIQAPSGFLNKLGENLFISLSKTASCQCLFSQSTAALVDKQSISSILSAAGNNDTSLSNESIQSIRLAGHNGHCSIHSAWFGKDPSWYVSPTSYTLEVTYEVEIETYELVPQSSCDALEDNVDEDKCSLVSKKCLDLHKTKIINGQTYSADCWNEELTYRCHSNETNTCKDLLQKGCTQLNSVCKTKDGDDCIEWEQTFECYERQSLAKSKLKWEDTPCLNGDCVDQSWEPNRDMPDSLSKLAICQEAQKDMDLKTQTIFIGDSKQCSRKVTGVENCCKLKGWGKVLGLAHCDENEKKLADLRQKNMCIHVGTYCAEKKAGICIRKKTSFCCYQTKLARIVNEQGARQLGLSFGNPKNPNCRILTFSDLTRIDFGKIDFSELFQDMANQTKIPNISKVTTGIQQSMQDKSRLITDKQKNITQGRSNENF